MTANPAGPPPYSSLLVPITCRRCGAVKRSVDGQMLYVSLSWAKGRRMVCPTCFEGEQILDAMEKMTSWNDDDEDGMYGL